MTSQDVKPMMARGGIHAARLERAKRALVRGAAAHRASAPSSQIHDAHVPAWLQDVLSHEGAERLALRKLIREIDVLLERRAWATLNVIIKLPHIEQLPPLLRAGLLRVTFSARQHLPGWDGALRLARVSMERQQLVVRDYLSGLTEDL